MWRKLYRKLKLEYYKLVRMKGAASFIARGFSIGMFIEFITLPTIGTAFLLLYPLNVLFRSSFSASLIAFVIGKILLPLFMYTNKQVGNLVMGKHIVEEPVHHGHHAPPLFSADWFYDKWEWFLNFGITYLVGSAVVGLVVAIASYFLVYGALVYYRKKRAKRTVVVNRSS
ncbi:DUF2062 domain-containing protein [Brevibacillus dissolubilis]|uniref:DUF2062 domain-containing protein n=1 Tax=Brevibacillus dissolubilis TaxID=1844116 RepID=UPI00111795DC|nr:DUF2062 domain-containing protein [Brevibacillus dissolubilis]